MNKPRHLAAILLIFAVMEGAAQDSAKTLQNSLEASYRIEHYPKGAERSYMYFQYGRKAGRADLFAKVMCYTLGDVAAYLFEGEAYIKHKQKGYSYLGAAWSASSILPNYRLRAERYQNWKRFEYSFGAGVLKPHVASAIPMLTGTLGYYFSDYFIYARPSFSYVDEGISKSVFVQARRYLNRTDFVALSALRGADTGASRDLNAIANSFGLDTYLVRVNGQAKAGRYKFGAGFDYGGIYIPTRDSYMDFAGLDIFINREF